MGALPSCLKFSGMTDKFRDFLFSVKGTSINDVTALVVGDIKVFFEDNIKALVLKKRNNGRRGC